MCAQVVLLGLNVVVPLMSAQLLQFPKLCRSYFSLLSYMLEVYPEQVRAYTIQLHVMIDCHGLIQWSGATMCSGDAPLPCLLLPALLNAGCVPGAGMLAVGLKNNVHL